MTPPSGIKILMTTDAVGGAWVFTTTLARELCRRGARVTLVTLGPPPADHQIWSLNGVDGLELEVTDLALEWMEPEGSDLPRAHIRLAALDQRIKPDLVHLNGYREASLPWSAPLLVTAHSCVRSWWIACRGSEPGEPRWANYIDEVGRALAAADVWVAPTRGFRDMLQSLYAPQQRGQVVWNGVDAFSPAIEKEKFILAAGRLWDEAKNVKLLTGISASLDWPLKIAGAMHFPGTAAIGEIGTTAERVGELYRPQLLAMMQRAAVFAACPVYEPFGLTVLEAGANGCALVLSDIPTLRELWQGAALFADPRNPASFHEALQRVCRDRKLRERLQQASRRRAARYSVAAMADGYWALYRRLLGAAKGISPSVTPLAEARP